MSETQIETSKVFDILINDRDEVLLAIDAREGEPQEDPILVVAENVMLVRNDTDSLHLPDIPDDLKEKLLGKTEILVAETDEDGVAREYMAQVVSG